MDEDYSFEVDDKGRVIAMKNGERVVLGDEQKVFAKMADLMAQRDFEG